MQMFTAAASPAFTATIIKRLRRARLNISFQAEELARETNSPGLRRAADVHRRLRDEIPSLGWSVAR